MEEETFGDEDLGGDDTPMYLEDLGTNSLDMMQIPMPLDIPFPIGSNNNSTVSMEFSHVMNTDDLIDYSSSSHIRQRGQRRVTKLCPVARYFPLVPPLSYSPPGNNIKSIQQQMALRMAFLQNPKPSNETIHEMSKRFGLPSSEISTWFKGERYRFKKRGVSIVPGNASVSAWYLSMHDLRLGPHKSLASQTLTNAEERTARLSELRESLTPYQLKRSRSWAEEYSLLNDSNERAFRVAQLVDRQDARLKKEFRGLVAQEPSLGIRLDQEFKARKSCADPTCGREVVAERADSVWEFMRNRFGCTIYNSHEKYVDADGNILLDAGLLSGLEMMFMRHRDYFMALVHRLSVQESLFNEIIDDGIERKKQRKE